MLINAISPAAETLPRTNSRFLPGAIQPEAKQRPDDVIDAQSSAPLTRQAFSAVVANTPLISIDLIVEDSQGCVLLGLRNNPPAKGYWFVPGGRIRKNEPLNTAFARIALDELGQHCAMPRAKFIGVYEHFYDTDFADTAGATTHYVVLAFKLEINQGSLNLPHQQHSQYLWINPRQPAIYPNVHPNTQAYF